MKHKASRKDQQLRFRRFMYALYTYVVVTLATVFITSMGLGDLSIWQWAAFIGLGVFGNLLFAVIFKTNTNLYFSDPSLTFAQIVYSALWGMVALYSLPEARPTEIGSN